MSTGYGEHWYDYNNPAVYTCNWCEGYIPKSRCYSCTNYNSLSVEEAIQKQILKVVKMPSEQYLNAKSTLIAGSNISSGVGKKHDSYHRYLSKKKSGHLKKNSVVSIPKQGNKTQSYSIIKRCTC